MSAFLKIHFSLRLLLLTQGSATGRRKWWAENHRHATEITNREIRWGNTNPECWSCLGCQVRFDSSLICIKAESYGGWLRFYNWPFLNKNVIGIRALVTFSIRGALRCLTVYPGVAEMCVCRLMLKNSGWLVHLQTSCKVPNLFQERQRMSDRLEDTSLRLKDEMDLYKRMMDKLRQNRLEFNKEREATQEVGMRKVVRPGNCIFIMKAHLKKYRCTGWTLKIQHLVNVL